MLKMFPSPAKKACFDINSDQDNALSYLVQFSNGKLRDEHCTKVKFDAYKLISKNENHRINVKDSSILVATTEKLQYSGATSSKWLGQSILPSRYYIGVFNKRTEKLAAYNTSLVYLKPILQCDDIEETLNGKSYREKVDSLATDFGSKRKKKAIESRMKYIVNEGESAKTITSAIKDAAIKIEKDTNADVPRHEGESIPPQNDKATSVEQVYNLDDIISNSDYESLKDGADILLNAALPTIFEWQKENKYCSFVCTILQNNFGSLSIHKAKLLLYFHYMMMILKLGYKDMRKKDPAPDVPFPFKESLLDKFTVSGKDDRGKVNRTLPPKMKDKLMAYSTVLALMINSYVLDATWLQRDFKANLPKMYKIAFALGCHVNTRTSNNTAMKYLELKLPLFKPDTKVFSRKKKGR